jgi:Low-density lipoprotein receptor repeat class B
MTPPEPAGKLVAVNDDSGRPRSWRTGVLAAAVAAVAPLGAIAVDSRYLYWANFGRGTIGSALLNGSSVSQGFLSVGGHPRGMAVDPGR